MLSRGLVDVGLYSNDYNRTNMLGVGYNGGYRPLHTPTSTVRGSEVQLRTIRNLNPLPPLSTTGLFHVPYAGKNLGNLKIKLQKFFSGIILNKG